MRAAAEESYGEDCWYKLILKICKSRKTFLHGTSSGYLIESSSFESYSLYYHHSISVEEEREREFTYCMVHRSVLEEVAIQKLGLHWSETAII